MAILDDRKNGAIEALTRRFSRSELPMEEYERLVGDIQKAADLKELAVIEDIVLGVEAEPAPAPPIEGFLPPDQIQSSYAILSERRLYGPWLRKNAAAAVSFLGSHVIDMREVEFPSGRVVLDVFALLGSVEIIVPRGLSVRMEALPVAGEAKVGRNVETREREGGPLLVVSGSAILGSIVVKQR